MGQVLLEPVRETVKEPNEPDHRGVPAHKPCWTDGQGDGNGS